MTVRALACKRSMAIEMQDIDNTVGEIRYQGPQGRWRKAFDLYLPSAFKVSQRRAHMREIIIRRQVWE